VTYSELAALADGPAIDDTLVTQARELARTERSLRASVLYAVMLLRTGKLAEAQAELEAARTAHGDTSAVLINLAKVSQAKGDSAAALSLARTALSRDPDDEIALGFWSSAMRLGGREPELVAELPKLGGFRGQLVLAAYHLEHQAPVEAERAYVAALDASKSSRPCVETLARDLRAYGEHALLLKLLGGRYDLAAHGPFVGLVLAGAHAALNQLTPAETLLDQVRNDVPADAQRFVTELEALLVQKRVATEPAAAAPALRSVPFVGPVWAAPLLQAGLTLPIASASRLVAIAQLSDCTGDRAVVAENDASTEAPTPVERACRAVPLLLSEALTLSTTATGMALIATHGTEGLTTLRAPLDAEGALELASAHAVPKVLVTGLFTRAITSELELELSIHDLTDGGAPQSLRFSKGTVEALVARAERELKTLLEKRGFLAERLPAFSRPAQPDARLVDVTHQVLQLVLTATGRLDKRRLWGVAAALDAADQLTREHAGVDTPALLFAAAFLAGRPQTRPFAKSVEAAVAPFAWSKGLRLLDFDDLTVAAEAYVELFGPRLPVSEESLVDDLFHASSEKANVVTLAIRRHSYVDFRSVLERHIAARKGA
jgi:tetratricopeptide (TPR) repeat protein